MDVETKNSKKEAGVYNKDEIFRIVIEIFAVFFGIERSAVKKDSTLEKLDLDSLDYIELMFELEERFVIKIENGSFGYRTPISEIVEIVFELVKNRPFVREKPMG